MLTIFLGLTPFIFITLLGFVLGRLKVFDLYHAKIFNLFLFYVAVPCLLIKLISQSEIAHIDFKQLFSYLLMQFICGLFAYFIAHTYFKKSKSESIIWALTVALSNHVTLLLPITEIFFDNNTITQVTGIILMDSIILLSVITFLLEYNTKKNIKFLNFFKNLLLNPVIFSIVTGIFLLICKINISETAFEYTLVKLASCVSPIGLFAIGIILSFYTKNILNKLTFSISILKLIISPLILILISFILFDINSIQDIPGAFFVSVAPCGHTAIVLCAAYNVNSENIIKALFISTVLSILTIFLAIQNLLN